MEASTKRTSWFVRILIVAFCLFLGVLVVYRYFYIDPRADISGGLLVMLAFILVLVLSELFDNFSIGTLLSVSRELKRKEEERKELKAENTELRSHIVAISTTVSQRQSSTNIVGIPETLADLLTVRKAAPEEIENRNTEEETPAAPPVPEAPERRIDRVRAEDSAISKFVAANNLQSFNLIRDAKLATQFSGIDPVMDITPIFDGYLNTSESEVFIEVRQFSFASAIFRDRLYVMLTKLHHYRAIKKANVYLSLIVLDMPETSSRYGFTASAYTDRVQREFGPAISSGLLRVHHMQLSPDEVDALCDRPDARAV